jgi:hypothetical protein
MARTIQLRRDTAANWTSSNPILAQGEFAWESDTGKFKIGDGLTAWTALAYRTVMTAAEIATALGYTPANDVDLDAHTSNMNSPHGPTGQEYFMAASGRYFAGINSGSLSTMPISANNLRAWPFIVTRSLTIDEIRSEVTAAVASTTYRIGIYDSDASHYPGNLVANSDTGTFDSATTGVKSALFASNIVLTTGLYWFVVNSNGGATLRAIASSGVIPVFGIKPTMGAQGAVVGLSASFTYAAMPASFPVGATDMDTNANPQLIIARIA